MFDCQAGRFYHFDSQGQVISLRFPFRKMTLFLFQTNLAAARAMVVKLCSVLLPTVSDSNSVFTECKCPQQVNADFVAVPSLCCLYRASTGTAGISC